MSDHADTIRAALTFWSDNAIGSEDERALFDAAWEALDAYEAENQRLEEQRDTALRRIADWQMIAGNAKAENQRLRDAINTVSASTDDEWAREQLHAALAAVHERPSRSR